MDEAEQVRKSIEVNILMQNYGQVRQELMFYMSNYKSNVKYLNYVLVAVVAIVSISMKDNTGFALFRSRLFWIMSGFSLTTIVGYVSYDLLESQYALKALASRAAVLEEIINRLIGKNWLIWESHLSPQFFSIKRTIKGISNPSVGLLVHWAIFVIGGLFTPTILMYLKFWDNPAYTEQNLCFKIVMALLFAYSLGTGLFAARCNFTIFSRMSKEALRVTCKTVREHGASF
jgi:hypothetical protein